MAGDCAASLQVCALRVARLDAAGAPLEGANNMYITDKFTELGLSPQIAEGEVLEQRNGCGELCVVYRDKPRLRGLNLSLTLCAPDPELIWILAGGTLLLDGADVVGWQAPEIGSDPVPNGVSIEAWTKAIVNGAQAVTRPWIRWVMPRTYWQPGDMTLGNSILTPPLAGYAEENPSWGNGPANDWTFDSTRIIQKARDDDVPVTQCGRQAVPVNV